MKVVLRSEVQAFIRLHRTVKETTCCTSGHGSFLPFGLTGAVALGERVLAEHVAGTSVVFAFWSEQTFERRATH